MPNRSAAVRPRPAREDQRAHLQRILDMQRLRRHGQGVWAIEPRDGGPAIGTAALKPLQEGREIEVGWHLARSMWGNGYATEAGRALVRHGFDTLRLARIVAVVHPGNVASVRVVERLGMRPIGRGRHYDQLLLRFELLADDPRP